MYANCTKAMNVTKKVREKADKSAEHVARVRANMDIRTLNLCQ